MKIVVGITGASGAIYAKRLLDFLSTSGQNVEITLSKNGRQIFSDETGSDVASFGYKIYEPNDFSAPFASGSAKYDALVIVPASMGTLGRIASGASNDLISRVADVFIKERRTFIVVPRETPYSSIHLENLLKLSQCGVRIMPASPSFYSKPQNITALVDTVTARILDHLNIEHDLKLRYGRDC